MSQVHVGGVTYTDKGVLHPQNTYANMRAILDALGIKPNSNVRDHHNHFHIYLRPPERLPITANLLADSAADPAEQMEMPSDILAAAQTLLAESSSNPDEEMQMFVADVPYIPMQEASVLVADAGVAQGAAQTYDRVIGICHLSANPYDPTSAQNVMGPPGEVKVYYFNYERDKIQGSATVSVLKAPAHGKLVDEGGGDYSYFPDKGFLGKDRATLLVEMGGKKIRMEYFFRVLESVVENESEDNYDEFCPQKVRVWKISSLKEIYGNDFITAVNLSASQTANVGAIATDPSALSSWLRLAQLSGNLADMSGVKVSFADLTGGAVGQTIGSTITLDTTAAGHGWYIDPTPLDNSDDYLPTSNPYVW